MVYIAFLSLEFILRVEILGFSYFTQGCSACVQVINHIQLFSSLKCILARIGKTLKNEFARIDKTLKINSFIDESTIRITM